MSELRPVERHTGGRVRFLGCRRAPDGLRGSALWQCRPRYAWHACQGGRATGHEQMWGVVMSVGCVSLRAAPGAEAQHPHWPLGRIACHACARGRVGRGGRVLRRTAAQEVSPLLRSCGPAFLAARGCRLPIRGCIFQHAYDDCGATMCSQRRHDVRSLFMATTR